jgi:hypothetical protein
VPARAEHAHRRDEPVADPPPELGRRRLRIRDDEDRGDVEPLLDHEPQIELLDRERLPGAGAGLDRRDALERHECGRRRHASSST